MFIIQVDGSLRQLREETTQRKVLIITEEPLKCDNCKVQIR